MPKPIGASVSVLVEPVQVVPWPKTRAQLDREAFWAGPWGDDLANGLTEE